MENKISMHEKRRKEKLHVATHKDSKVHTEIWSSPIGCLFCISIDIAWSITKTNCENVPHWG